MNKTDIPVVHGINLDFAKYVLLPTKTSSNKLCYMVIINTWLILDTNGTFEACNEYDLNVG